MDWGSLIDAFTSDGSDTGGSGGADIGSGTPDTSSYDDFYTAADNNGADLSNANLSGADDPYANETAKFNAQDAMTPGSYWDQSVAAPYTDPNGTGFGNIWDGLVRNFKNDPLRMLQGGLAIMGRIHAMRSGSGGAAHSDMANMVAQHLASQGMGGGGASVPTHMPTPYGYSADHLYSGGIPQITGNFVPVGPLTNTFYSGRR